jgi:tetratricopeptide (TPR) repeat protein
MKGDLAEGVLPGVLRTLYIGRKTGMLHVTREEERGSICFMKGNIVYGETNIKECHLGETLVRHGLLTAWDLERAIEMMTVTGRRLGQVLVDLGVLDANGLEDALAMHVREVLLTVFSWREGSYRFDAQDPATFQGFDHPLPVSMGEVILDAIWSIGDADVIRFGLGDLDRVLVPASDPLLRFQRITLNATDGFLLSRVDGVSTATDVLRMAPVSAEEAQRSLLGLVYTGMVEWAPERPKPSPEEASLRRQILDAYDRLRGQTHHAILGVSENANRGEIHAAFVRLAKVYHPDAHHSPELLDLKDKLEALFWRVTEAYRVLFQEPERVVPAAAAPPPAATSSDGAPASEAAPSGAPHISEDDLRQAEDLLERASESLATGQQLEALTLIHQALPMTQGRLRRRARVLNAQALLRSEGRRAAEEELKAALEEDRGNFDAHCLLGMIYKAGGANALAAASFRRVLDLKPRHSEALEALASLQGTEPAASKTGGLLGLFKRS